MFLFSLPSDSSSRSSSRTTSGGTASTNSSSTTSANTASTVNSPLTPSSQSITTATPQAPRATRLSTSASPAPVASTGEDLATAIQNATGGGAPSRNLLSELQNYLTGLKTTEGGASGSGRNVDLSTAINAEAVNSIVSDTGRTETLLAHLPTIESSDNSKKQLKDTISSPQFQQALSMFSSALQSGQLGPVVSQFELSPDAVAAANSGDLEQFVKALEKTNATAKKDDSETPMEEDKPDA